MNKLYASLFLCGALATTAHAQDTVQYIEVESNNGLTNKASFGIKIGVNYSNVYDTEGLDFEADPKFGLATGLFLSVPIVPFLGIQAEVLYSQKGFKATGDLLNSNYVVTRTSNYIDVPIMIMLRPAPFISILAGPQYSLLINQKNEFENGMTTIEQELAFDNDNFRRSTFCFLTGIDINYNQLVIGGRFGWDFLKNNGDGTTTTPRYKNVWLQFTLGYRL